MRRSRRRGQVTVPKVVREALGIMEGDHVVFRVEGNRAVLARTPDLSYLPGTVRACGEAQGGVGRVSWSCPRMASASCTRVTRCGTATGGGPPRSTGQSTSPCSRSTWCWCRSHADRGPCVEDAGTTDGGRMCGRGRWVRVGESDDPLARRTGDHA
ncbi:MAG: AbrB/MazE/SpoVT family DNA-binding domain-containing protein [Euzebyaceae bacterium]|nr:AbrB/MazE/SpoVT family DNA-binding domain-containing protein [Euzebyaceae bacterium]